MASKKECSERQERAIADFLGWNRVTGSGSRNFHPGDVVSDSWLGECKTHVGGGQNVVFMFDVWDKISNEAQSQMKHPVLFVDDGSQTIDSTMVMIRIPDRADFSRIRFEFDADVSNRKSFMRSPRVCKAKVAKNELWTLKRYDEILCVMHIKQFKKYVLKIEEN